MNSLLLIKTLCFFLEYLSVFILSCGFLSELWKKNIVRFFCFCIPLSILGTIVETFLFTSETAVTFANLLLLFLLIWLVFRRSFSHTSLLTIVNFCTCMSIQLFLVLCFSFLCDTITSQPILANLFTVCICLLLTRFCKINILYDSLLNKGNLLLIGLINLSSVFLLVNIYNKMFHTSLPQLLISFIAPLLFLFFINALLFNAYIKEQNELKTKEEYANYLPLISEMLDQIQVRQHNFDNELQAIRLLPVTCHDYDSLCLALNNYSAFITSEYQDSYLLKLNMKCLAAFLYKKLHDAKQENKNIKITINHIILYTIVPEYELINMAGILVDNMVEAITDTDYAELIIENINNQVCFTTINPGPLLTPALRRSFFDKGYSTKSDSHERGYGLYLLQQSIHKYNGRIYMDNMTINNATYVCISFCV